MKSRPRLPKYAKLAKARSGRRREPKPQPANCQAGTQVSLTPVFDHSDVTRIIKLANLKLSDSEREELREKLNSAVMHFHIYRDDLLEPPSRILARELESIASSARELSIKVGTKPAFFPAKESFKSREVWLTEQRLKIDQCFAAQNLRENVAPRYLLRAMDQALFAGQARSIPEETEFIEFGDESKKRVFRKVSVSEEVDALPLNCRAVVTALALCASIAADTARNSPNGPKRTEQEKSWVVLMRNLIEIFEPLGVLPGFSNNAKNEPSGPFFRMASAAIEHICSNVPQEFSGREDLRVNAPQGNAIADLIRAARKEISSRKNRTKGGGSSR